jgi:hypothetical protein
MEFMESERAAYKIYNRATGMRILSLNLECAYENSTTGSVACKDIYILYTKTVIDAEKIHTIAVTCKILN